MIKRLAKKYFDSLAYYYSYLGYRIFVIVGFSIFVGILDGLGLTMFIPLLTLVERSGTVNPESLGNFSFLLEFVESINVPLNLISVLVFMVLLFLLKGLVQYFSGVYRINVLNWFVKQIRIQNIKNLNRLSYKYFISSDVGRIQNTLTGEVDRVAVSFTNYFLALQSGVMVIVYMAFAFQIDPKFALLVTVGGMLTNFLYKGLYKNTKGFSRTLTGENSVFQSLIIQHVANYKYLKATGSLKRYGDKLRQSVNKIESSNKKIGKLDALLTSAREPLLIVVVVVVIFIQTSFFGSDLGPILTSLIFFYRALTFLMLMQARYNKFLGVSGSLENMQLFSKELKANKEATSTNPLEETVEELSLSNVSFYYGEKRVLKNIDLNIQRKETIAFVGESGSGKTTLVNIIAGLLPVDRGDYFINDSKSKEINIETFQEKIGYITQDPVIFNDTLYNNVTFWADSSEGKDRFWNALQQAAILDFVNSLPEKERTVLGNNGVNLSGGQKQRLSIARELFKEVEILILDEATSALDSETEKEIQENIDDLKGNYTILIVAHRISTIKNADRIIVMKDGSIINIGSFNELMETSVKFKKMVELQEV